MIYKLNNGGVIKLQSAWTKIPRVLRKAIKRFGKIVDKTTFVPTQVKYYRPTIGKTTSIRINPSLIDFDAIMRGSSKELIHVPKIVIPDIRTYYLVDSSMPLNRPISEAERRGIPKSMRSNPKALEDPYYWGYQQWNQRYNAAIKAGDMVEAQRLRDLHFKIKAPNTKIIEVTGMPKEVYHGSLRGGFTVFDSSKTRPDYNYSTSTNMFSDNRNVALGYANNDPDKLYPVYLNLQNILEKDFEGNRWNGSVNNSGMFQIVPMYGTTYSSKQEAEAALQKMLDQYYPNNPAKQAEQRHYTYVIELMDPPHLERSTNAFSDEIANTPTLDGGIIKNVRDYYDLPNFDENPELYEEITSPHTDYFVKDPRNIKSSASITYDDFGRIIPIVKRDNFHNPDKRYKQGGILKAQNGDLIGPPVPKNIKYTIKAGEK